MPGIGYVKPNEVVSMVTVNEMYARNRVLLTKHMPGIGHVESYPVASTVII